MRRRQDIETEFPPFVFDHFRQAAPSGARRYGGLGLEFSLVWTAAPFDSVWL